MWHAPTSGTIRAPLVSPAAKLGLPIYKSRLGIPLLGWHGLSILWAILVGLRGGDWKLAATLLTWTLLSLALYRIRPRSFIVTAISLAVVEEVLVYSLGGGLQGKAKSLSQDLILTIPVFTGFILGWFLSLKIQPWSETALYLGAGLHGFFLEFLTTGLIFNPTAVLLLGGPVLFIYASIVLIPRPPLSKVERRFSLIRAIGLWSTTLVLMVIGAVVADHWHSGRNAAPTTIPPRPRSMFTLRAEVAASVANGFRHEGTGVCRRLHFPQIFMTNKLRQEERARACLQNKAGLG
jgi:hypothetical protein